MITFTCPYCATKFKARDEHAGKKTKCRCCGKTIQVPAAHEPAPVDSDKLLDPPQKSTHVLGKTETPQATALRRDTQKCPYCAEEILADAKKCKHCGEFLNERNPRPGPHGPARTTPATEVTRWEGSPSYLYYIPLFTLGTILVLGYGIGLLIILYGILDRKGKVYTVTNKRVHVKAGIVSRRTSEVGIRDRRSIIMKQSILERLFGLGSVAVGSAGTAGLEVVFAGIPNPEALRALIRKEQEQHEPQNME